MMQPEQTDETRFVEAALARSRDAAAASAQLAALHADGRDALAATPLPGRRSEAWKYTRIRSLLDEQLLVPGDGAAPEAEVIDGLRAALVRFVDGAAGGELPRVPGATLCWLSAAEGATAELFARHLGRLRDTAERPFVALNQSLMEDALLVHATGRVEVPVELLFSQGGQQLPRGGHPRVLVVVDPGAELVLIERYEGASPLLLNQVTEAVIGANGSLTHVRMQLDGGESRSLCALETSLARDARYALHQMSLGSRLKRNEIGIRLEGEGARVDVRGAFLTRGDGHVDNQMNLQHVAPHCTSEQIFRGIAGERSRGVLNGRIHIHPGAQKTEAELNTKNLLLSNGAEIDAKPELEIYADDVKCAHGATVGRLDEKALYYLRSRGVGETDARTMLSFAFLGSVVDQLPLEPVRVWLRPRIERAFMAEIDGSGAEA